jgi:cytochrome b subunit of formate dehydrogenase
MTLLLVGVFAFFWTHSGLWFYRSWKERKQALATEEPYYDLWSFRPQPKLQHHDDQPWFRRFPAVWRAAHLIFLLTTMTLVLTGMTALYASSFWAPTVARLFGGPRVLATIHHTCAALFLTVFAVHVTVMAVRLVVLRQRPFRWFGPDSLVIRWQDFIDALAMFRWFFGLGPRPKFDRWTYWEKFDYWAVFWGVTVIGGSGCLLYFRVTVARFLPGYVFNVATIFHGEEAILAAVFLFTVHFFNNHFRPDKFPLDTVMFTGAVSLEELKREHAVQYERLMASGELESYRVRAPSPGMARGSRILGFTLIAIGLILLTLVVTGFVTHLITG